MCPGLCPIGPTASKALRMVSISCLASILWLWFQQNGTQNGSLASGHMDQNLGTPPVNFEPHPNVNATRFAGQSTSGLQMVDGRVGGHCLLCLPFIRRALPVPTLMHNHKPERFCPASPRSLLPHQQGLPQEASQDPAGNASPNSEIALQSAPCHLTANSCNTTPGSNPVRPA